jgi:hypothetical protein
MVEEKFPAAAQETLMTLLLYKKYIKMYGVAVTGSTRSLMLLLFYY